MQINRYVLNVYTRRLLNKTNEMMLEIECRALSESCIQVESGPALFGLAKIYYRGTRQHHASTNISAESGKFFTLSSM